MCCKRQKKKLSFSVFIVFLMCLCQGVSSRVTDAIRCRGSPPIVSPQRATSVYNVHVNAQSSDALSTILTSQMIGRERVLADSSPTKVSNDFHQR